MTNFTEAPLYFVRSGDVNLGFSKLWGSGLHGYYWSIRALLSGNSFYAYALNIGDTNIAPSGGSDRYSGYPLRCLAS